MWFLLQVVYSAAGEIKLTFNKELENKQYLKLWYQASLVCSVVKNLPAVQDTRVQSLVEEIPWRREWLPTPVFLPGKSHGQRSLAGYSPRGHRELGTTERLSMAQCVSVTPEFRTYPSLPLSPWVPTSLFSVFVSLFWFCK